MFSGSQIENCSPVDRKGVTPGNIIVGLLVDCKSEASVSTGEAGLDGNFQGEEIGEGMLTTALVRRSKQEGVKGRKSSSGSQRTERQPSEGGKVECSAA